MSLGKISSGTLQREHLLYTSGRVLGTTSRPLFLWIANNYFFAEVAQGLAIVLLASSMALAVGGTDPHRRFYWRAFSGESVPLGIFFFVYIVSFALLGLGAALIAAGLSGWVMRSIFLGVAGLLYILTEKLADEVLRFGLFEKTFESWGLAMIRRTVLQLLLLGLCVMIWKGETAAWSIVTALSLGNALVFVPMIPGSISQLFKPSRRRTLVWLVSRSAQTIRSDFNYWILALVGASIGYLDRLLALFIDQATLPLFMLVVMSFSVVHMSTDFFYMSRYRTEFLRGSLRVKKALTSYPFLNSFVGGMVSGGLICVVVLITSRDGESFPLSYVIAIALLQGAVALTLIPREISYWHGKVQGIIRIDALFWGLTAPIAILAFAFNLSLDRLLFLIVTCCSLRLFFHIKLSENPGRSTTDSVTNSFPDRSEFIQEYK